MKRVFLIVTVCFTSAFYAQSSFVTKKEKHNCIGIYTGLSIFNPYGFNTDLPTSIFPFVEGRFWMPPAGTDLLISYKHKKNEIIAGVYGTTYTPVNKDKLFLFGGTTSYLYHFSEKKIHLFMEGNFKFFRYATIGESRIAPYNSTINSSWWIWYQEKAANITTMVLHPAIGVEIKIWKCIYSQFAIGSGVYIIKASSLSLGSAFNGFQDRFTSIYSPKYGLDWYARMALVFRIYNF